MPPPLVQGPAPERTRCPSDAGRPALEPGSPGTPAHFPEVAIRASSLGYGCFRLVAMPRSRRLLDRLPLLAGLPEAARARLAAAARPARYAAGEAVFRRGDPGEDGMLLVLDGPVRVP